MTEREEPDDGDVIPDRPNDPIPAPDPRDTQTAPEDDEEGA